jgi:hypothetical protein
VWLESGIRGRVCVSAFALKNLNFTMNKTENKKSLVTVTESGLLALVAAKLKDTVLFPEKQEEAKEYLKKAKIKTAYNSFIIPELLFKLILNYHSSNCIFLKESGNIGLNAKRLPGDI